MNFLFFVFGRKTASWPREAARACLKLVSNGADIYDTKIHDKTDERKARFAENWTDEKFCVHSLLGVFIGIAGSKCYPIKLYI